MKKIFILALAVLTGCTSSSSSKLDTTGVDTLGSPISSNGDPKFTLVKKIPQMNIKGPLADEPICMTEAIDFKNFRYAVFDQCGYHPGFYDFRHIVDLDSGKVVHSVLTTGVAEKRVYAKPFGSLLVSYYPWSDLEFFNLESGESTIIENWGNFKIFPAETVGELYVVTSRKVTGSELPPNPITRTEFYVHKIANNKIQKNIASYSLEMKTASRNDSILIAGATVKSMIVYELPFSYEAEFRVYEVELLTGKTIRTILSYPHFRGNYSVIYNRYMVFKNEEGGVIRHEITDLVNGQSCSLDVDDVSVGDSSLDISVGPIAENPENLAIATIRNGPDKGSSIYNLQTCKKIGDYNAYTYLGDIYFYSLFPKENFFIRQDPGNNLSLRNIDGTLIDSISFSSSSEFRLWKVRESKTVVLHNLIEKVSYLYKF